MKRHNLALWAAPILVLSANSYASDCTVDPTWISQPSMPTEVAQSGYDGASTFCDFYQFSTQAYLYLMTPSSQNASLRNFQIADNYPALESNSDGSPANSCNNTLEGHTLSTSLDKLSTGQAGGGATIYAQDGNIIYYEVNFNKALCEQTGSATKMQQTGQINFPSGTTEIKTAWKKLSPDEILSGEFVTQEETIDKKPAILGMVGMHIAIATTDHPEFVWATYEHNKNTPNCDAQGLQDQNIWLFADAGCTRGLPGSAAAGDDCKFNMPLKNQTAPTGTQTNICAVYPYGTATGDHSASDNLSSVTTQNTHLYTRLKSSGSAAQKTLLNYFNVGALWVSDINKNSGGIGVPNERGSLRLANTVAETDYQHVDLNSSFSSNCFGCHNYLGQDQTINNNITSQSLSHIFVEVVTGQGQPIDVATSKRLSRSNSKLVCDGNPKGETDSEKKGVCQSEASYLQWNKNWTNKNTSAGSVCGCEVR